MKVIGRWSKSKNNITVNLPKMRKVGNRWYPYKSKYLGDDDDGYKVIPEDVEKDIYAVFKIKVKLIPGGNVVEAS